MLDKDQDTFFDENGGVDTASEALMQMINHYDKKIITDLKPGTKVTGKVSRIGGEYVYLDIGARNEAFMKRDELADRDGTLTVKEGDTVTAFIVSNDNSETLLSKSMGGNSGNKQELYDAMNNKIPVQGKVSGVSKDGLTVKIMGQRAFCPISQIDIKFTEDVNVYLGKNLDFVITRISEGGKNVIVSRIPILEQTLESTIVKLEEAVSSKTVLHGTITKLSDFGLFVDVGGLEGLVHISEISWEHTDKLSDSFTQGQQIDCIVLQVSRKKPLRNSKISLSIKQMYANPWDNIRTRFACGESVQGKVVRITNFGAFVELIPGVDGLIHVSEMSWLKKVRHPSEVVSEGSEVTVKIIAIDETKKTISLSLKDIADDPWLNLTEQLPPGSEVTGTVAKKSQYGYFVDLREGVTGLLVFSKIVADKRDSFKEGDSITVCIESIDTENRRISLSHGMRESNENRAMINDYLSKEKTGQPQTQTPARGGGGGSSTEFGAALMAALKGRGQA